MLAEATEAAFKHAVLVLAADGAIEQDELLCRIRGAGEALNLLPRQALSFLRPALPVVVGPPDASVGGSEHRAAPPGAIKVKGDHLARRPRARRPRLDRKSVV